MIRALIVAALLLASPALFWGAKQSQDPAASAPQTQSTERSAPPAKTPKPKPKKVWTEDNLADVGGTISVVGDAQSASKSSSAQLRQSRSGAGKSSSDAVDPQTLARLRQQLQKLESDLAAVDQQLDQLKGFSKGDSKNAGGIQKDTWQYNSSSVEEQIRHLEEKKMKIQATIDNLMDAARASGVEPGQLR
jgi:chromosome segregation ATPase